MLMLFGFVFIFIIRIIIYFLDFRILIEWLILRVNSFEIEIILLLDWISLIFIRFVILISSKVMFYRVRYISNEKSVNRFFWLILIFITSILIIIIRPNILRILFGWDGLGLVSFCLVIYYQNYISFNSGIVTVLCNRVGDIGILITIRLVIINGRWRLEIFFGNKLELRMLFVAAIRKRAQIPFSTWLPIAIAAPTPVSALVHSSTLVTAGVYLIIRFNKFYINSGINLCLLNVAVFTIFMSGLMANVEMDLKKIIALSTLRQLGLIIMILGIGGKILAFYHLLTHAVFKSLLFMCAGIIIHIIINNQDVRLLGNIYRRIPIVIIIFVISNFALCGFPFIAGFYSKDLIIEMIYNIKINVYILIIILISLIFTVIYSFRLIYYIFWNEIKFFRYLKIFEEKKINLFILLLMVLSIIVGSLIRWVFFFDCYIMYLRLNVKILTLRICLIGVLLGIGINLYFIIVKFYYLIYYLRSIWFLSYFYLWSYKPLNVSRIKINEIDKIWVEFIFKGWFLIIINYLKIKDYYNIYIFIYVYFIYIYIVYILY